MVFSSIKKKKKRGEEFKGKHFPYHRENLKENEADMQLTHVKYEENNVIQLDIFSNKIKIKYQ